MIRKLFFNATLSTPVDHGRPLSGPDQGQIRTWEKAALLCTNGLIEAIGPESDIRRKAISRPPDVEVNLDGRCIVPGFVDPHTHLCFVESREREFSLRLRGTEYLEILKQGGGILSTVGHVREADEEALFKATLLRGWRAMSFGTTTVEIKSGYGLETGSELKMLRVIDRLKRESPLDVVATFLGAHAVPEEYRGDREGYVQYIIDDMLPSIEAQGIATFCDVFCEEGVFSIDESRRILSAARERGLMPKIHADEVHDMGGAALAAEMHAASADHLLAAGQNSLELMARKDIIAVLLPATAYSLRKAFAPARKMIELGIPIALATDCNPGSSYTESMPFVFGLAVLLMGLSVEEALVASTLNAAYAVGVAGKTGSLEVGKQADFLVLDGETPAIFAYHCGANPVRAVYKRGEKVIDNEIPFHAPSQDLVKIAVRKEESNP